MKMLLAATALLLLAGCSFLDQGFTTAPDKAVSLEDIQGCYYYEGMGDRDFLCAEMCVDSVLHFHTRLYSKEDVNLESPYNDSVYVWDVESQGPEADGTMNVNFRMNGPHNAVMNYLGGAEEQLFVDGPMPYYWRKAIYSKQKGARCVY
jgi:hypothetical protein